MSKIRVGVLRGGPSSEYDVSLKTGGTVLKHMPEKYHSQDILITKDGVWHLNGLPKDPEQILRQVDVVFNALHGQFGEDGKASQLLESHSVPYTGSKAFSSSIAMNKELSKKWFKKIGLKTPLYATVTEDEDIDERAVHIFKTFPHPGIVKPVSGGSSIAVSVVQTIPQLKDALRNALRYSKTAIIEEFIRGREATCGVIEDWRGVPSYALFPTEIVSPKGSAFFDYQAKYGGESRIIAPGNFTEEEKKTIQDMAIKAHNELGLRHYSRSDFIVAPRRGVYILEINSLPGLTSECTFPKALQAVGGDLPKFLDHIITLALAEKR